MRAPDAEESTRSQVCIPRTGDMIRITLLMLVAGAAPLAVGQVDNVDHSDLGRGWRHTYDLHLYVDNTNACVVDTAK